MPHRTGRDHPGTPPLLHARSRRQPDRDHQHRGQRHRRGFGERRRRRRESGGELVPKRTDLKKILVIGSGPIVIGQACEFDYSGVQACKVLRAEGYEVVLVNSNPATIMTDPEFADATYIEPITPEFVARVVERERPDACLPTLGGQTGLNVAMSLAQSGVFDSYGVELIGAKPEAIRRAEDRKLFKETMTAA